MLRGCSFFSSFESFMTFLHDVVQTIASGFCDSFVEDVLNLLSFSLGYHICDYWFRKLRWNCLPLKLF